MNLVIVESPAKVKTNGKYLGKDYEDSKKILELNPSHPILKSLLKLEPDSDLQKMVIEQILDSALLVEGLHPDAFVGAPVADMQEKVNLGRRALDDHFRTKPY